MNKEDAFQDLAKKLLEYLSSTEVFLKEQTPDFVNQLIAYETWAAGMGLIIPSAILAFLFCLSMGAFYCALKDRRHSDEPTTVGIWCLALCLIPAFWLTCNYAQYKKLQIAPKVFLLEKAKELLK